MEPVAEAYWKPSIDGTLKARAEVVARHKGLGSANRLAQHAIATFLNAAEAEAGE